MVKQKTPKASTASSKKAKTKPVRVVAASKVAKATAKKPSANRTVTAETKTTKTVKPASITPVRSAQAKGPFARLRMWNFRLAMVLVLEAVAIVVLGKNVSVPVTTQYLAVDPLASEATGEQVLAAASRHLFDLPMTWVVVAFLVLLAAVYVAAATIYRRRYEAAVERGVNEVRWLGIGLSAAVAIVVVALLSGVHQLSSLLMLAGFMLVGCLLMLVCETLAVPTPARQIGHLACRLGVLAIALPLVVLALGLGGALLYGGHTPGYLYGIYASSALFVVAAGLATHFRIERKGRWTDSYFTEQAYMFLMFAAVSVLAWQIFAGVLVR